MSEMKSKMQIIYDLFLVQKKSIPVDLRLFLITKEKYIRVYKGSMQWSESVSEHSIVNLTRCERGSILDLFSKLEFFINELVILRIVGFKNRTVMIDDVLEHINFFSKVRLLRDWEVISKSLQNRIRTINGVRNGYAHAWDDHCIKYKGKLIKQDFKNFKAEVLLAWEELVEVYTKEFEKVDIKEIIEKIEKAT